MNPIPQQEAYKSPQQKINRFNLLVAQRYQTYQGITDIQREHIFPVGNVIGVSLLGVIGTINLVVGLVFLNSSFGLYVACAGAGLIALEILAIVLLVRRYHQDEILLNSILNQDCATEATHTGSMYYDIHSEDRVWNDQLNNAYDGYVTENNHIFHAIRSGRKYTVEISRAAFSYESTLTISI